jgi:hypothetical protein
MHSGFRMNYLTKLKIFVPFIFFSMNSVLAQNYVQPIEKTFSVELKSKVLVILPKEITYLDSSVKFADKSPESKAASVIRAMQSGNYQYWFDSHDTKSQLGIDLRNKENNRDLTYWKKLWIEWIQARKVKLVAKYEYVRSGNFYTLVRYEVASDGSGKKQFRDTLVLKQLGGVWVLTHDLVEDRIITNLDGLLGEETVFKTERQQN